MDSTVVDFMNNVEPCVDPCGDCERHGALPDPAPHGAAYTRGLLGYAYWMCGNIGSRTSNTCPTNVAFTVYDTTFDGDGDCAPGFSTAANEYGIGGTVDWSARAY